MKYPTTRLRRNRTAPWLRKLVAETEVSVNDLILPIFVLPGKEGRESIKSMPGVYRLGEKELIKEVKEAKALGINAVALFPVVPDKYKDENGSYALNKSNFLHNYIKAIKDKVPGVGIICDVALDPYTSHGHDGVLNKKGDVDNDKTNAILAKQALALIEAGADMVAPSDMMDGRIGVIRAALDKAGHSDKGIISYAVKYASSLYGPFRDAVGSGKRLKGDKKTYQMNPANIKEAIAEAKLDVNEGADIIMVKPGIFYLDVIAAVKQAVNVPVFAYQVSAEYAMIRNSGPDNAKVMMEAILCFKRAGANAIFTYAAKDIAKAIIGNEI